MNYHDTIGAEVVELMRQYKRLYGIYDMYYKLEEDPTHTTVAVTIGIAPIIKQGLNEKHIPGVQARLTLHTYELETPESARACIPKIHQAFIRELHSYARKSVIHRYQAQNGVTIT